MLLHLPQLDLLTPQMRNLVNFPLHQHMLVVGAPGTWKSVVAIYRYKELIKQWKKVLFICFNQLLKELLLTEVPTCKTINHWYLNQREDYFSKILKNLDSDTLQSNWFGAYIDNDSKEKIEEVMHRYNSQYDKFDAIIIDEGQDLKPEILQWLSLITKHISIFADPNQPLKEECSDIREIEYIFQWIHKEILDRNFRNTKEIYEFASQKFMQWNELANNPNLTARSISDSNSIPEIRQWVNRFDDQLNLIAQFVAQHPNQTIGIFVKTRDQVEWLYQSLQWSWVNLSMYHEKNKSNYSSKKNILLTTYTSAKWLEFDIVILLIGKDMWEKTNQKLYVLSTRAKKKLYYIFA